MLTKSAPMRAALLKAKHGDIDTPMPGLLQVITRRAPRVLQHSLLPRFTAMEVEALIEQVRAEGRSRAEGVSDG